MVSEFNTPAKRKKIEVDSDHAKWESLGAGRSLGFHQLARGGRWKARMQHNGKYLNEDIGLSEVVKGDGLMTYDEATDAAVKWFNQVKGTNHKYTVRQCLDDYKSSMATDKGKAVADLTLQRIDKHLREVLGLTLASTQVRKLTAEQVKAWHRGMVTTSDDKEARRKSQASANRVLSTLKAALNLAYEIGSVANPVWMKVKPYRDVTKRKKNKTDLLSDRQVAAILKATDGAFHNLCKVAMQTGARYGELCKARVKDFDADEGTLTLTTLKGGRATKEFDVRLSDVAVKFIKGITKNKLPNAYLLTKDDGEPWKKSHQFRPWKAAVKATGQNKNKLDRVRSKAVFYDLRHYHISKSLMTGIPILTVAENCGTSVKMIEQTYGKTSAEFDREMYNRLGALLGNEG